MCAEESREGRKLKSLLFWFRMQPATKAPCGCPSPRQGAEENGKKQAETGGSGQGQFNRTANKGNRNNNDTDKGKTQNKTDRTTEPLSRTAAAACSRAERAFPPRRPPHWNPAWQHMVWNTRLCLARWGQPALLCPFLDSLPGFL